MNRLKMLLLALSTVGVVAGCDHSGNGISGPVTVSEEAKTMVKTQTCTSSEPVSLDSKTLVDDTDTINVDSLTPGCTPPS